MKHPQCGHCGYDLIGAESNRCPECGLLFIEAGVTFERDAAGGLSRISRAIVLALVLVMGLGAAVSSMMYFQARAARERAIAQQQAALAQQRAALAQQQAAAARLSVDDGDESDSHTLPLTDDSDLFNIGNSDGRYMHFDKAVRKEDYSKPLQEFNQQMKQLPDGRPPKD